MRLFINFFSSGAQRILGYVRPRSVVAADTPKTGKRSAHLWGALWEHFELGHPTPRHSDVIALQMRTRGVQTLNWDTACVFPSLLVRSLYLSASVCVHAPVHVPAPVCSLFPHGMCFWIWVLHFAFFDLNFGFDLYFTFFLHAFLYCFLCYFGFWSLDLFCFMALGFCGIQLL